MQKIIRISDEKLLSHRETDFVSPPEVGTEFLPTLPANNFTAAGTPPSVPCAGEVIDLLFTEQPLTLAAECAGMPPHEFVLEAIKERIARLTTGFHS